MNTRIRCFGVGLATLFLAVPSFVVAQDDDPPAREADNRPLARAVIDARLKEYREQIAQGEQNLDFLRDEVKKQLTDFVAGQQIAIAKAQKEFDDAKEAREKADFAVKEYEEGIYKLDHAMFMGKLALAKSDRDRARNRLKDFETDRREGRSVDPNLNIAVLLESQQADFDIEQVETEIDVLEKYTKGKEIKKRQAVVAAAEAVEAEKQGLLQLEKAKATKRAEQAERLKVRSPEDLVVALLDGAIANEGKVVTLLAEARKIEAEIRDKPAEAASLTEKLQARKTEVATLMDQAKAQILESSTVAEQVKALRTKLRDAEAEFRKNRDLLERLEREMAPKP